MQEDGFLKFLDSYIAKTDILLGLYARKPEHFDSENMKKTKLIRETAIYLRDNYITIRGNEEKLKEIISDFDYPISKWATASTAMPRSLVQ